jgi:hypothetical protein
VSRPAWALNVGNQGAFVVNAARKLIAAEDCLSPPPSGDAVYFFWRLARRGGRRVFRGSRRGARSVPTVAGDAGDPEMLPSQLTPQGGINK